MDKKTVCLLAEGSYPYVFGGVSSWIQDLITSMPERDFKVLSIMPSRTDMLECKYILPPNLVEMVTIYLQDFKVLDPTPRYFTPTLDANEIQSIRQFLRFDMDIDWETAARTLGDPSKLGNPIEFLHSKLFWELLVEFYNEGYSSEGFNEFFWTVRSMFVFFITIMQSPLPEADIYHAVSTGYPGLLGVMASRSYKKPFILTEHGIYAREREEDIIKAQWVKGVYKKMWIDFFYFISKGAYVSADAVVSLFERNRHFQVELGSNPDTTVVIANGIDTALYSIKREEHTQPTVGAVLRLVPIKDVKTLIRAFSMVVREFSDALLYVLGPYDEDKDYYNECLKLVGYLELDKNIIFTGRVKPLEYIPKFDVMVLTSISEGQPLVILEGMASGVPYVSTDVGSCRELLEGREDDEIGHAGIIVKPVSPSETAEAILRLLRDKELREEMGRNGRIRAEVHYKKNAFVDSYREIYGKYD